MHREIKQRIITSIFLFLLFILMFLKNYFLLYVLIIITVISLIEFYNLINRTLKSQFFKICLSLLFLAYIFVINMILIILTQNFSSNFFVFFTLLICFISDIGGLLFGKIFKGPKLTNISPNKTISGSIGCFILPVVISIIFSLFNLIEFNLTLILFIFSTVLFCQLGDLLISFLKRKAKVKDTGNFLPGHGGVLDRIDSILLGFPAGLITFYLIS